MSLPVSLRDVAGQLQLVDDASTAYLNRSTGETLVVSEEDARLADDGPDLPEWQREVLATVRDVRASGEWLEMPSRFEIDPYRIMEDFCTSAGQDELLRAIRGPGAFRRFRDAVERLGRTDEWYAHERRAYERVAARWLAGHGVPFEPAP